MSFWDVVKGEFRRIFIEEPKRAAFIFGIPIVYVILLGMVYAPNVVKYIPAVVYDQDQTAVSRAVVQAFEDSERYNVVSYVTSQEQLDEYLRENKAQAALVIPPNFSQDVKLGRASQVLVDINGSNLLYANSALVVAQELGATISASMGQKLMEASGQLKSQALNTVVPIGFGTRILNNPTYGYSIFMLPGLGANGLQLGIVLAICTVVVSELRRIEYWQGTSSLKIILGKILPYWFCGTAAFVLYIVTMISVFPIPFRGDIFNMLFIGSAFVLAVVAVGVFYSSIAPDETYAVQLPIAYIMPAFLFSGYVWPKISMNTFSLFFSAICPLSYMADNVRDVLLSGYAPFLVRDALTLIAAAIIVIAISIGIFDWRRKRHKQVQTS